MLHLYYTIHTIYIYNFGKNNPGWIDKRSCSFRTVETMAKNRC